ncbi:molecular chaperone, partial [Turicibacter sanguinis]|nr:molecular chaperone [Turicibacter sanguinis]
YIKEINNRKGSVQVCYNPSYRQQENPLPLLTP